MRTHTIVSKRGFSSLCTAAMLFVIGAAAAQVCARPVPLPNLQNRQASSSFTLDFGALGGVATADITSTYIRLIVDPEAETAEFADYVQFVDPLILPDGSNTGRITVVIEEPKTGKFDRATGQFTIPDNEYVIYFEGDLSSFNITSPFRLPSTSNGVVEFNTAASGETRMEWAGVSALPSPFQPGEFIAFNYTSSMNGSFTLESDATWVMTSTPAPDIIDARQPHPMNDALDWQGYDSIDITFNARLSQPLGVKDIQLTETGGDGIAPNVVDVVPVDERTYRILFDEPLEPAAWTRIQVPGVDQSGSSICVGSLPGDVNGDRTSNVTDLIDLVNSLRGQTAPLQEHQCDLNRSGSCTPADLITLINLLTGAGEFDAWDGVTISGAACR